MFHFSCSFWCSVVICFFLILTSPISSLLLQIGADCYITYEGRKLSDSGTMVSLGIDRDATLHVRGRLLGGMNIDVSPPAQATAPVAFVNTRARALYKLGRKIGSGSFGIVWQVHDLQGNMLPMVVKKVRMRISEEEAHQFTASANGTALFADHTKNGLCEVGLLQSMSHNNIVIVERFEYNRNYISIYMEQADCDLAAYLKFPNGNTRQWDGDLKIRVHHISLAVAYLHDNSIMHRDLKPHNVLVFGSNTKLCDFGLSKCVSAALEEDIVSNSNTLGVGTLFYSAPEVASGYEISADVFSLGAIFLEMLASSFSRDLYFAYIRKWKADETIQDIAPFVLNHKDLPDEVSQNSRNCISSMLSSIALLRPTSSQVTKCVLDDTELPPKTPEQSEELICQLNIQRDLHRAEHDRLQSEFAAKIAAIEKGL
jgi:serine/threonine protein kinase